MKKILFILLAAAAVTPLAFAQPDSEELVPARTTGGSQPGQLVDLETRRIYSKLDDLERRLRDLERNQRSADDRVRSMERSVSDLRRRGV
jgi:chromosome segregation ATPase